MKLPNFAATTAAVSSSLGMLTIFGGATRDLPITSKQFTSPLTQAYTKRQ